MGITVHKSDIGAVPPLEYHKMEAGEFKVGIPLRMDGGRLFVRDGGFLEPPSYICMADRSVDQSSVDQLGDELLPVMRVRSDIIYEISIDNKLSPGDIVIGETMGLEMCTCREEIEVELFPGPGVFEVVSYTLGSDGFADKVRGRFVQGPQ